jgi:1,4-dihydroxy-2-naphthoate octaprenyltransferase
MASTCARCPPPLNADPFSIAVPIRPGSSAAWLVALRLRSLPVAVSPVLVGAALRWQHTGSIDTTTALVILAAALLIQIVTNLQNDVGYTARGGERDGTRIGLPRATANGSLSVRSVRIAIVAVAALAVALGVMLMLARGWPVLAIGAASATAALAYMGRSRPIAYTPFGEATVFVFFGLVAVMGTDWVLTGGLAPVTLAASVAIGGLAAAALAVNNHRAERGVVPDVPDGTRIRRAAVHRRGGGSDGCMTGTATGAASGPASLVPVAAFAGSSGRL